MGSTKLLLLLVFLAVCVGTSRPLSDDAVEDAKQFAARDTKEETQSWIDWAHGKFSKSFRSDEDPGKQATKDLKDKAEDTASRATETMKSAASGASEYASEKATDAKEAISEAVAQGRDKAKAQATYGAGDREVDVIKMPSDSINRAKDTMADTYEDAKQKMQTASDKASSMAHNVKDNMAESMEYGRDKAGNVYDQGKQKMNMASDTASEKFYDAKDKASDVYDEAKNKINDHMTSDNANDESTKQRMEMAAQGIYDAKNKVKIAMGCGGDKAVDAFEEAKERMSMAGDKANDVKDNMGEKIGYGRDKVAETFDQAEREVGEAYAVAKDTMTEKAKAKYEAAKEKASDATGDLGAKLRNNPDL
ncbi:hypothetical protein CR513_27533, partial [Mucuna pruriens]